MTSQANKIGFYITPPHDCSYLEGKEASTIFADPNLPKTPKLYTTLANYGFRRSGKHIYQPQCKHCNACIPVRIPVNEFNLRRTQKRNIKSNSDLKINILPAEFKKEHFELYSKYISNRHAGGGMDNPTPGNYLDFLIADWMDTWFYEFCFGDQIIAVAVTDRLQNGLSAVYTFFDPAFTSRGLGIYAILYQIEQAKRLKMDWLYLGYWIKDCKKMVYKKDFHPLEYYVRGRWIRH